MSEPIDAAIAEASRIRGDLRDLMIGAMGQMTRLWKDMPETEQIALANILDAHASAIVTRIAVLMATQARPKVLVTLDSISAGESCKAGLTLSREAAALLIPFTKQTVALHIVNAEYFQGQAAPAPTQPDQRPLPMGEPVAPASGGGGTGSGYAEPIRIVSGDQHPVQSRVPANLRTKAPAAKKANGAAKPKTVRKSPAKTPTTKPTGSPFQ